MSENEKLVERLLGFDKAYPLDIFPEPGTAERAWLAHHRPGLQDRVAASMGRHFAKHAREAAAALTAAEARIKMLSEALAEAIEFADQDAQALTAAGIALVERWRRALKEAQP